MVLHPRPIRLDSGREVNAHLDAWAAAQLTSPDRWSDVLAATRDWSDYSARNQLLLASYPALGPVAGVETWRLVPTAEAGTCAVRSGEHGLPVRVPVTTTNDEPDPHLGRARPTAAAVAHWEWRNVFCLEQLARRPDPDQLAPAGQPTPVDSSALLAAVTAAARRTVRGRLPSRDDPVRVLVDAAGRLPRSGNRPPLAGTLAEQAAWLTLARVGHRPGDLPAFDPAPLAARERWAALLDVIDTDRRLTAGLGRSLDTDLLASPLPRMEIDDDRVVPAGRRNRLPRSSLAQLPVGQWVDVGPYTPGEWAARGVSGAGKGSYLRINTTAYLVAVEHGERASWHLEDTRARVGAGRLGGGEEPTLEAAQATALATVRARYPQLDPPTERDFEPPPRLPVQSSGPVVGVSEPPGPISPPLGAPDRFDAMIASLAQHPAYHHDGLVERVGTRLADPERLVLAGDPSPAVLVELLGAAGCSASTIGLVLRAEDVAPGVAAELLPVAGMTAAETLSSLHQQWGLSRVHAAELAGASPIEMRAAGCRPAEILAARPDQLIPTLPDRPHLWELAGGTLATTGHPAAEIAAMMASHAPNADCYAAGIAAGIGDPTEGLAHTVSRGMPAEAVVALSERYGISPADTARALGEAGAGPQLAVEVLYQRCDGDPVLTTQIGRSTLQLRTDDVVTVLREQGLADEAELADLSQVRPLSRDHQALIAAHQPPLRETAAPGRRPQLARLLENLPEPDSRSTVGSGRAGLLRGLPESDPGVAGDAAERSAPGVSHQALDGPSGGVEI